MELSSFFELTYQKGMLEYYNSGGGQGDAWGSKPSQ